MRPASYGKSSAYFVFKVSDFDRRTDYWYPYENISMSVFGALLVFAVR